MPSRKKQVIVIGAGMGGLSAALKLALSGLDVRVLERGHHPGGKLREQHVGDQSFYTGPTVLTMPWVFEEIFREAGANLGERVKLHQADVLARHAWSETERLDLFGDHERSAQAIAEFAGAKEADGFRRFAAHAKRVYAALDVPFIQSQQPTPVTIFARFGWSGLGELMRIKAVFTLWQALGSYFKDPRLRQLFGRYATYVGASPYHAPATLMLVADVESRGVHAVEGGIHRLPEALAELAVEKGVELSYGTAVAEILVEGGRARGVRLENGEQLEADAVICNADAAALGAGLFGEQAKQAVAPIPPKNRSHSVVTWNLLARPVGFPMQYHNVFFPRDYADEFKAVFEDLRLPAHPTVYLCAQDRGDPSAPEPTERERMLIVVNAPSRGDSQVISEEEIARCGEQVTALLQHCGLTLAEREDIAVTTPAHFERAYPASGGAVFGRVNHGWWGSFDRPGAVTKIERLFTAGGSAHPGPGIPMASISGRLAADMVLKSL
ncbi:phytoene desaturase family protein [Lamprobacter modestohalophilus]|uniref:1-hydroxycarotenoid 3,4-desaturase CrtD n=1 Tax=Lamprobacter modestohalophilus TaxID=1064514 RepID=UPI002ADED445|nr:1-hydroxycarotenoid 3,4-desaturase CrtD [Lamprobacter modestohalophilus]MEA1049904.1 phytoene desaturase family protein [Lamprobacter modestohalophilus]